MVRSQAIEFIGARALHLSALLDQPEGEPLGYALFAHCFTCTKDFKAAYWIGRTLAQHGIALLRFDFAGLGASEGEFAASTLSSNVEDLLAAADFLRTRYAAPRLLVGHSLGGTAVLAAAPQLAEIRAVCTIGAPYQPAHLRRYVRPAAAPEEIELSLLGHAVRLRREFVEDLEQRDLGQALARLRAALLILHAPQDSVVGIEQAGLIFQAARHPKSFVALDGADHLLARQEDAQYAAELIAVWARRYLG